ncbi:hypothetical protein [Armatimonas sp.]|uniref:hypothetical protein n=1 Tax=Armatimonas sp. TaxID=1872638 RepID=UPI003751B912
MACTPERASAYERTIFGFETDCGVAVKAAKRLLGLRVQQTPVEPQGTVTASGIAVPVGSYGIHGAHTTLALGGQLAVNDLIIALALHLCDPTVTTPAGATNTRRYTFFPDFDGPKGRKSATMDFGGDAGAHRCTFAAIQSLGLSFGTEACSFSGNGIGQRIATEGVTMETSIADVPLVPLDANGWAAYVADVATVGTLFTDPKKLTRCFEYNLGSNNIFSPLFVGNSAAKSFVNTVDTDGDGYQPMAGINIEQDAFADQSVMEDLRKRNKKFSGLLWTGALIEAGFNYKVQIRFPFNYRIKGLSDGHKVKAGEYDLQMIYDSGFGGYLEIVIDTDQTTLMAAGATQSAGQFPDALNLTNQGV